MEERIAGEMDITVRLRNDALHLKCEAWVLCIQRRTYTVSDGERRGILPNEPSGL